MIGLRTNINSNYYATEHIVKKMLTLSRGD